MPSSKVLILYVTPSSLKLVIVGRGFGIIYLRGSTDATQAQRYHTRQSCIILCILVILDRIMQIVVIFCRIC